MNRTLHIITTVLPGGRIVVEDPELAEGDEVHVVVQPAPSSVGRSALQILGDAPGKRSFRTSSEVDDYLRQERDSWRG